MEVTAAPGDGGLGPPLAQDTAGLAARGRLGSAAGIPSAACKDLVTTSPLTSAPHVTLPHPRRASLTARPRLVGSLVRALGSARILFQPPTLPVVGPVGTPSCTYSVLRSGGGVGGTSRVAVCHRVLDRWKNAPQFFPDLVPQTIMGLSIISRTPNVMSHAPLSQPPFGLLPHSIGVSCSSTLSSTADLRCQRSRRCAPSATRQGARFTVSSDISSSCNTTHSLRPVWHVVRTTPYSMQSSSSKPSLYAG